MIRRVALEQLFGREHDLVGGLASATASAHAVGDDTKDAARNAWVANQRDLVLLVLAVTLVDACRGGESIAFGHGWEIDRRAKWAALDYCA